MAEYAALAAQGIIPLVEGIVSFIPGTTAATIALAEGSLSAGAVPLFTLGAAATPILGGSGAVVAGTTAATTAGTVAGVGGVAAAGALAAPIALVTGAAVLAAGAVVGASYGLASILEKTTGSRDLDLGKAFSAVTLFLGGGSNNSVLTGGNGGSASLNAYQSSKPSRGLKFNEMAPPREAEKLRLPNKGTSIEEMSGKLSKINNLEPFNSQKDAIDEMTQKMHDRAALMKSNNQKILERLKQMKAKALDTKARLLELQTKMNMRTLSAADFEDFEGNFKEWYDLSSEELMKKPEAISKAQQMMQDFKKNEKKYPEKKKTEKSKKPQYVEDIEEGEIKHDWSNHPSAFKKKPKPRTINPLLNPDDIILIDAPEEQVLEYEQTVKVSKLFKKIGIEADFTETITTPYKNSPKITIISSIHNSSPKISEKSYSDKLDLNAIDPSLTNQGLKHIKKIFQQLISKTNSTSQSLAKSIRDLIQKQVNYLNSLAEPLRDLTLTELLKGNDIEPQEGYPDIGDDERPRVQYDRDSTLLDDYPDRPNQPNITKSRGGRGNTYAGMTDAEIEAIENPPEPTIWERDKYRIMGGIIRDVGVKIIGKITWDFLYYLMTNGQSKDVDKDEEPNGEGITTSADELKNFYLSSTKRKKDVKKDKKIEITYGAKNIKNFYLRWTPEEEARYERLKRKANQVATSSPKKRKNK
jgi:hypothetical protein